MPLLLNFIKHNRLLIIIIALGLFFRFYDYPNRYILNQDQARDASIALYALKNKQLPLLGPPSSAGPFNFGPIYNYIIILSTLIFPTPTGPWVAFTLLSAVTIIIFFLIGKTLGNNHTGHIFAFLAAISSGSIFFSSDMLNTVIVAFFASLSLLFMVRFTRNPNFKNSFFQALCVGFAINCHFQALGLLTLLALSLTINKIAFKKRLLTALNMVTGLMLSFLPLIIFDFQQNYAWSTSIYNFYTQGQNKFYYPVRWLTDIRDFWPSLWGETITFIPETGYLFILIFVLSLIFFKKIRKLPSSFFILVLSLLFQVIILRYYKGARSREYHITFHPYFIFLTAFSLWLLSQTKKNLFKALLVITTTTVFYSNFLIMKTHSQAPVIHAFKQPINQTHIGNFSFYTKNSPNDQLNLPIFYLLYKDNRISPSDFKIGTCHPRHETDYCPPSELILYQSSDPAYVLYNLSTLTKQELSDYGFHQYTPKTIYDRLFINYPQALKH